MKRQIRLIDSKSNKIDQENLVRYRNVKTKLEKLVDSLINELNPYSEAFKTRLVKEINDELVEAAPKGSTSDMDKLGDPASQGWMDKCIAKMSGKVGDEGAYCAQIKDKATGTTFWRGKGKKTIGPVGKKESLEEQTSRKCPWCGKVALYGQEDKWISKGKKLFCSNNCVKKYEAKFGKKESLEEAKIPRYYSADYYDKLGGHGEVGNWPTFNMAFSKALDLFKREQKSGELGKSTGYIGVSGNGLEFAIMFVDKEYISGMSPGSFSDRKAYDAWMKLAKVVFRSGKPAKGKYPSLPVKEGEALREQTKFGIAKGDAIEVTSGPLKGKKGTVISGGAKKGATPGVSATIGGKKVDFIAVHQIKHAQESEEVDECGEVSTMKKKVKKEEIQVGHEVLFRSEGGAPKMRGIVTERKGHLLTVEYSGVTRTVKMANVVEAFTSDESVASELEDHIQNTRQLYNQKHLPIKKNLSKKMHKGVYKRELAVKLMRYLVDNGAKSYAKQHSTGPQDAKDMFTKKIRDMVAVSLVKHFEAEFKNEEYDFMEAPKKKGDKK